MASKKLASLLAREAGRLNGKKVMVYGLGRSGLGAVALLKYFNTEIFLANSGEVSQWMPADWRQAQNCFREEVAPFDQMDLIVLSPGIAREHPLLQKAVAVGVELIGEIELASWFWTGPIVSLTGTNGKTTTVTLLGELFRSQGLTPFVGGNIGVPFCEAIVDLLQERKSYDLAVLELSSFQLESAPTLHSDVSGILNITFSHGERYENLADYTQAKLNIYQNSDARDIVVMPKDANFLIDRKLPVALAKEIPTTEEELISWLKDHGVNLSDILIPGVHNLSNVAFAVEMVESLLQKNFKRSVDIQGLRKAISEFKGVSHRIERVATGRELVIFNDSKSTNWESTRVAVRAMAKLPRPLFLIIGGQKRGRGDEIAPHLDFLKGHVDHLFLIGETSALHAAECAQKSVAFTLAHTLEQVCEYVKAQSLKGTLLFSPAAPSFDQFNNYVHRGDSFKNLIQRILP